MANGEHDVRRRDISRQHYMTHWTLDTLYTLHTLFFYEWPRSAEITKTNSRARLQRDCGTFCEQEPPPYKSQNWSRGGRRAGPVRPASVCARAEIHARPDVARSNTPTSYLYDQPPFIVSEMSRG
ncbi:unnamed protein product [Arctia plantaginis]|uniref:Uncharacterized protein n=1 Tax=Arctia plantaginis TaxID=874455 RepID=A0A8S1BP82_ARCPL|nr:unnamed protein product [Arctia plantaginis]